MDLKQITSHAKEYGFIFQSSEIYDGLAAVYDYGQTGSALKYNIKNYWWRAMVQSHEEIVGIESAIFMHPNTWKASGHVDAFNDPLIDNRDSKKRYRADVLVEEFMDKLEKKAEKEITKAAKRFGDDFDREVFVKTNARVQGYIERRATIGKQLAAAMSSNDLAGLKSLIEELEITCPVSGSRNWTDVRQFNLMFSTQLGNMAGDEGKLYLRPETAQGSYVNFLNVAKTGRKRIPFGIAQMGKAFRNEIIARQFIFRMREFEQMEMQFFVRPGDEMKWYEHWREKRLNWHQALGAPKEKYRYHDHDNLAHYANAAVDIQYEFPFGFKELEGIHSRTDFDLSSHAEVSGRKIQYFDPELDKSYTPYVVETAIGLDRMFLSQVCEALREETVPDADGKESTRVVMKFHPILAPVKCAVLPLVKNKAELTEKARRVFDDLKYAFDCQYDEKDAIGRRYRRQDAIGTPWCVTVDFDSLEDDTVTLRDRDSLEQKRMSVAEVKDLIKEKVDLESILRSI